MVLEAQLVGSQQQRMKLAALWLIAVLWLPLVSAERVAWSGLQVSESQRWLRCFPLQLVLFAVAVEMSVAQKLKLHLSPLFLHV